MTWDIIHTHFLEGAHARPRQMLFYPAHRGVWDVHSPHIRLVSMTLLIVLTNAPGLLFSEGGVDIVPPHFQI